MHFGVERGLSRRKNRCDARLDKRERAVLEFSGRIRLRMNVGNFFQFQRAFLRDGVIKAAKRISARAISADAAAKTIVRSILAKRPPARVLVGRDAKIAARLRNLLPLSWFDSILLREFNIFGLPVTKPDAAESRTA